MPGPPTYLARGDRDAYIEECHSMQCFDISTHLSLHVRELSFHCKQSQILGATAGFSSRIWYWTEVLRVCRCSNRNDTITWEKMTTIKTKILRMWDFGSEGIRLSCIKFVQRIILVQTPGATDPRVSSRKPHKSALHVQFVLDQPNVPCFAAGR